MEVEEDSIDPDFSFAGRVRTLSPQELRELIEQATYGMEAAHPLKRALLRGIGVHHSGLPTKYRQVVEILFRCRYLQVVIATGARFAVCANGRMQDSMYGCHVGSSHSTGVQSVTHHMSICTWQSQQCNGCAVCDLRRISYLSMLLAQCWPTNAAGNEGDQCGEPQ